MDKSKHVQIISCGPGLSEINNQYGQSSDWVREMIKEKVLNIDIVKIYNGEMPLCDPQNIWIVTGSRYSVYDNIDWIDTFKKHIKKGINAKVSMLGICFGHQLLASCLGGKVEKNINGWELGSYKISLTAEGQSNLLFNNFQNNDIVYESHQDVVSSLPSGAIELAYTNKGNQSFCVDDFLYGVQFHPEFTYDVIRKLMDLRLERGVEVDDEKILESKNGKNILSNFIDIVNRRIK